MRESCFARLLFVSQWTRLSRRKISEPLPPGESHLPATMTTDENFIDFKCPYCTEAVCFSTDTARKVQECPECAEILIVPHGSSEFGHKIPIPITTPHLILRRLASGDWKDLLEFMADDELFRYSEGAPFGEEQVIQWLEADTAVKLTTPATVFCLAIQMQAGGTVIG